MVEATSKLLDANNTNQQNGTQTASFTILAKPAVQTTSPSAGKQTAQIKQPVTKITEAISTMTAGEVPATSTQVAAVTTAGISVMIWVLWAISLLVAFGL
jgi:hypothetical protein